MPSHFKTHGPFLLGSALQPLEAKELQQFWSTVESKHRGLQDAIGVYILAVGSGNATRPVYVGKAEHGFRARLKPNHDALRKAGYQYKGEQLSLLFIARVTIKTGRFVRKREKDERSRSIGDLEVLLMRECDNRGHKLVNAAGVKFYQDLVVPGFLHDGDLHPTPASKCLRHMLRRRPGRLGQSD